MPDDSSVAEWTRAADLDRLHPFWPGEDTLSSQARLEVIVIRFVK
jgi:hypothetical protein